LYLNEFTNVKLFGPFGRSNHPSFFEFYYCYKIPVDADPQWGVKYTGSGNLQFSTETTVYLANGRGLWIVDH